MKTNHKHKKKYGQNFLDDNQLLREIEEVCNISKDENILEIGPGLGFLTDMILKKEANLISFEIDDDLIGILNKKFGKFDNFTLKHIDFLEANLNEILKKDKEYKVVANIPYYITSPIINKLLEVKENISEIYIMVQKEVGERLTNTEGNKNRGVFTNIVQFYAQSEYLFTINKEKFNPVPKVDSAFIKFKIYKDKKYENLIDQDLLIKYVKAAFVNKRKNIVNNYKLISIDKDLTIEALRYIKKEASARAEELSVSDFIQLIHYIEKRK